MLAKLARFNMPPKNMRAFFSGMGLLAGYLILQYLEARRVFGSIDLAATEWLQTVIPHSFDVPLSFFSLLGSFEFTAIIIAILAFLFFRRTKTIPFSFVLFGAILLFELLAKHFVYHPAPPHAFFRYSLPFELPTAYVKTNYSFPSGHMSRTAFLGVISAFMAGSLVNKTWPKKILLLSTVGLMILMAISRVYLGEHWFSDVLGGAFLGSALGTLALVYY